MNQSTTFSIRAPGPLLRIFSNALVAHLFAESLTDWQWNECGQGVVIDGSAAFGILKNVKCKVQVHHWYHSVYKKMHKCKV